MSVTVFYTFYFAYSMFSAIDELCKHVHINVRRFHWIPLIIKIDIGEVEVLDSLRKDPKEFASVYYMIQK